MKFFLIHQYSGNKGDRAVLYAMCRMIKALYPDAQIDVATSDKLQWQGYKFYTENRINFTPWAWDFKDVSGVYWNALQKIKKYTFTILREAFLHGVNFSRFLSNPKFYKALKNADVVLSVGGHHFTTILSQDLVSGINYDAMCTLSTGKKLICFSQSFGPFVFKNSRNRNLTKRLLELSFLMPREEKSRVEIDSFVGNSCSCLSTYESVLSLSNYIDYKPICKREDTVGISIYCTQHRSPAEKERYISNIIAFSNHVIEKGFSVKFFPMEMEGSGPDDRPFISEIISSVNRMDKCSVVNNDLETLDHLNEVSKCKLFLGHKTHSTIFALATGTPLIGLAYHPKTIEFLNQFELSDNVIDDKNMTSEGLVKIFEKLCQNLDEVSLFEYLKSKDFALKIIDDFKYAVNSVSKSN